ncbi:MAG: GAF domain-containing protein [Acidobacteria bacterium]|nr:GAF domain-containing protein [Acidobacteriota bacterium]
MPEPNPPPEIEPGPTRRPPVRLRVRDAQGFEKTILFQKSLLRIGRDAGSDLRVDHATMAPCHVIILRDGPRYQLTDASGGAGTFLNRKRITTSELGHGDVISFGPDCPYEAHFLVEGERSEDRQGRALKSLLAASRAINSSLVLDQVLDRVMDAVMDVTRADRGFLMLAEPDGSLRARVSRNIARAALDADVLPASRGVIQEVVATRRTVFTMADAAGEARPGSQSLVRLKLKAALCAPILAAEALIGIIYVDYEGRVPDLSVDSPEILEALADHASVAIENARLTERMLLAERVSTVGRMVSSIVHDLRGPLAGIRAAAQLIGEEPLAPRTPRLTAMITTEVDRLSGMAQEILDYCRGGIDLMASPANLSAFLAATIEPMRESLQSRSVSLNLDIKPGLIASIDAPRLERVLRNVIDNAVEAMPDGGLLTISTGTEDGCAVLRVADTGRGMNEEVRRRVFEPFFTHGKKNGNGLGMAIASRVVEAHGGRVRLESAPGEGTTVAVSLPLVAPSAGATASAPEGSFALASR